MSIIPITFMLTDLFRFKDYPKKGLQPSFWVVGNKKELKIQKVLGGCNYVIKGSVNLEFPFSFLILLHSTF